MTKRISLISTFLVMAAFAVPSFADSTIKAVVHDVRGNPVKDARGNCVHTAANVSVDECTGERAHGQKLASVYFDFNKATLTASAKKTLKDLLKTLKNKHIEAVTIAGYADAIGSDSYNLRLSGKRAKVVQDFLKSHGFKHANVDVRALGKRKPDASCKALKDGKLHACLQQDRRVDVELSVTAK